MINKIISKISHRVKAFKKHPMTKDEVGSALYRYLSFNLIQRVYPKERIYNFIGGMKFYAQKGEAGIVANIYYKLFDYEESIFVINNLKENDLFVDIGANVGHFSLLAAGMCKANVIAFEPIPQTFEKLNRNVSLNNLSNIIETVNIGIGKEDAILNFTTNRGVMNSVASGNEAQVIEIQVKKLDDVLKNKFPVFLKIDVEGYEYFVLQGASEVLSSKSLKFIIIELNFSTSKYGHTNEKIFELLSLHDFVPIEYDTVTKQIKILPSYNKNKFNTIFIKKDSIENYA
ncbi:FkbM family methyltransferase [Flavobacterium sp. MMS24-S5]|uniref:FkbM family methyltransferase n=1 Tax=Flavobacterium sp. MMS24-S5 TaxID=3416605 RepID=UPI003D0220AA